VVSPGHHHQNSESPHQQLLLLLLLLLRPLLPLPLLLVGTLGRVHRLGHHLQASFWTAGAAFVMLPVLLLPLLLLPLLLLPLLLLLLLHVLLPLLLVSPVKIRWVRHPAQPPSPADAVACWVLLLLPVLLCPTPCFALSPASPSQLVRPVAPGRAPP
jgi:corin